MILTKLYYSRTRNVLGLTPTAQTSVSRLIAKRGSTRVFELVFVDAGGVAEILSPTAAGALVVKAVGDYTGAAKLLDAEWDPPVAQGGGYVMRLVIAGEALDSALSNKATIALALEFVWEDGDDRGSTPTITLQVDNNYWRDDAPPSPPEDPYPLPGNLLKLSSLLGEIESAGAEAQATARGNLGLGSAAIADAGDFATAEQGDLADGAIQAVEKGAPEGVAELDATGKVPTSQLPDSVLGGLRYKGSWDADSNLPDLTDPEHSDVGWFYLVAVPGTADPDGLGRDFDVADWLVFNGSTWDKVDNTEPVASEVLAGISRRATTAEAQAATNDTTHLTPAKGKALLDQRLASVAEANQRRSTTQILTPARLRAQTSQNLSADLTLTAASDERQILAPQTTDRTVKLPVIAATPAGDQVGYGHPYTILHDGAANSLLITNAADVLQVRLDPGESAWLCATSSGWMAVKTFRSGVVAVIMRAIDFTAAAANTTLYTPVAGLSFVVTGAQVRNDVVGGVISTPAQVQIDNGTDGQDCFGSITLTSPAVGRSFPFALAAQPWIVTATAPLRLRRTVAAAGTSPIHQGSIIVHGILD